MITQTELYNKFFREQSPAYSQYFHTLSIQERKIILDAWIDAYVLRLIGELFSLNNTISLKEAEKIDAQTNWKTLVPSDDTGTLWFETDSNGDLMPSTQALVSAELFEVTPK
jgi:uncharacterized protein YcsI (UPF0317 family)